MRRKPVVLIILDGFGYRESTEDNAIANARAPVWQRLWSECPHTLIATSGLSVGLPEGQMGNSEVGHMSLGSGRVVYQNITRIDKAIADGDFFTNPVYCAAIDKAQQAGKAVHIFGLLSPGGIHSHQNHIFAMIKLARARGATRLFVHPILDGRDTPPRSAENYLAELESVCQREGATIANIVGRYFAMDRDNRWARVEQAYKLYSGGEVPFTAATAQEALQHAYTRGEDDEFVQATRIAPEGVVQPGDAILFMNFRADRARELTRTFTEAHFTEFPRGPQIPLSAFVMTTEYAEGMNATCAYPPDNLSQVLGEYLARHGKTQLRIAETEKYAHVTFFFSGGREEPFPGEERILVPSPDVATYDLQPEMSAPEVADRLVQAIESGNFDFIACNFANGDMVGHTGKYAAAVKAVEALDECLRRVTQAALAVGGHCLITADHGNCEQMMDYEAHQPHTQHTTGPVPLVYVGPQGNITLKSGGKLADIAPTVLQLMDLTPPPEMSGHPLIA